MNEVYTIGGFDTPAVAPDTGTVLPDAATGTAIGAGAMLIFVCIYAAIIFGGLIFTFLNYVLQSVALFTLAKNRGMKSAWCAWVPLVNTWVVGAISDLHDRQRGLNRHWGRILLITRIFGPGLIIVGYLGFLAFAIAAALAGGGEQPNLIVFIIGAIIFYASFFVALFFNTVSQYGTYVCLYKIFDVVVPEKAVKYFIISLIVPLGCAICLMCCRKSMLGVPEELLPEEAENEVFTNKPLDQE